MADCPTSYQLRLSSADNFNLVLTHNTELAYKRKIDRLPPPPVITLCEILAPDSDPRSLDDFSKEDDDTVSSPFRVGSLYQAVRDLNLCKIIPISEEERRADGYILNLEYLAVDYNIGAEDILLFLGIVKYEFTGEDSFSIFTMNFLHDSNIVFELVLGKFESGATHIGLDKKFSEVQKRISKTLVEDLKYVDTSKTPE